MRVNTKDFGTGWFQVQIGIRYEEVDSFIEQLKRLKKDREQHFHLSSDYAGEAGIGDVEFYIQGEEEDNMMLTGFAISPTR